MSTDQRARRFGDWSSVGALCQTGSASISRPFYAGESVHRRMAQLRESIVHIRSNWHAYPDFMTGLQRSMRNAFGDSLCEQAESLFSQRKEWADGSGAECTDHSAIQLYTSDAGYDQMFATINRALRTDSTADEARAIRSAVFLVELLTIDLFNRCQASPAADNFEGIVYRGMCVSTDDLEQFVDATSGPIDRRYLSVPLAMISTSTNRAQALAFATRQADRRPGSHPLLWAIHVVGLRPDRLALYGEQYPDVVVSSICAVPIDDLSHYPDEREVLLRGPFLQLLGLRDEPHPETGDPVPVIDAMLITANRDHLSSVRLSGPEGDRARDLFRVLVTIERAQWCEAFAMAHDRHDDADSYRRLHARQRSALQRILESGASTHADSPRETGLGPDPGRRRL